MKTRYLRWLEYHNGVYQICDKTGCLAECKNFVEAMNKLNIEYDVKSHEQEQVAL